MYYVQYQYFDKNGNQNTKVCSEETLKKLIAKMKKHLRNNELYDISHVSPNLFSYDFTQHGQDFKGWRK
jgi:hypothetical protein